jgi:hypothetical protein
MKATDDDLRDALGGGSRGARARADRGSCPSAEALARAAEGASGGAPREVIEHLATCADCAFDYRVASGLRPWADGAEATLSRPAAPVARTSRFLPLALAASLAMCLGLVAWVLALRQQGDRLEARLADARAASDRGTGEATVPPTPPPPVDTGRATTLAQPQANVPLVDLFPRDAARGGTTAVATVDPSQSPLVVLILNVRQPEQGATYGVEIADRGGTRVWATDGVRAGAEPITLAIPTHLLSGDRYRVRLDRIRGDRRTPVEQYELKVERRRRTP